MKVPPGKLVVALAKPQEGQIVLSDKARDRARPDVGRVISSGCPDVWPGDIVLVDFRLGKMVSGFGWGEESEVDGDIKFIGATGGAGSAHEFQTYRYDMACPAKLQDEMIVPLGQNVLVEVERPEESAGGILLPEIVKKNDPVVRVVSIGPDVTVCAPGDRIVAHMNAGRGFEMDKRFAYYVLLPEDAIYAVMPESE